MIECTQCEFFTASPEGRPKLLCDPFSTIKEPECLVKWQFVKLESLSRSYEAMLDVYRRMAPMQERMMKHMERELDDLDDADSWKQAYDDEDDAYDDDDEPLGF